MIRYIAEQILTQDQVNLPNVSTNQDTIQKGLDVFYVLVGAIAFLLLIIAALRYTLAGGNADQVGEAKRMIIYTLVGLVVISLAATIVEFVLKVQA